VKKDVEAKEEFLMKKKFVAGLVCMSLASLAVAGCGNKSADSSGGQPITLKMNVTTSESSVWHVAAKAFKKEVEEKTKGKYKINIFGNEQLASGDLTKGIEMLFNGSTDVDIHSSMIVSNVVPKVSIVSMPWLFPEGYKSVDEYIMKAGSPGDKLIKEQMASKGVHCLGIGENGFRQVTNNVRPITKPQDLQGLKIRVPPITILMDVFTTLGADPTQMPFSECFTALQQGAVDGQENPYDTMRSAKLQEVQKYMTIWNYSYDPIVLSVSGKVWDKLTDEEKKIFEEAGRKACAEEVAASRKLDATIIKEFKDSGVQVNELSPEVIAQMKKAMVPVYEKYKDKFGEDTFNAFGYKF
jgi:tripartite ATP-independent transporter DctP family solute receptor